jgi:hypothetical protein
LEVPLEHIIGQVASDVAVLVTLDSLQFQVLGKTITPGLSFPRVHVLVLMQSKAESCLATSRVFRTHGFVEPDSGVWDNGQSRQPQLQSFLLPQVSHPQSLQSRRRRWQTHSRISVNESSGHTVRLLMHITAIPWSIKLRRLRPSCRNNEIVV